MGGRRGPREAWSLPLPCSLRPNQVLPDSLVRFRRCARRLNTRTYCQVNSTLTGSCCFFILIFINGHVAGAGSGLAVGGPGCQILLRIKAATAFHLDRSPHLWAPPTLPQPAFPKCAFVSVNADSPVALGVSCVGATSLDFPLLPRAAHTQHLAHVETQRSLVPLVLDH